MRAYKLSFFNSAEFKIEIHNIGICHKFRQKRNVINSLMGIILNLDTSQLS